MPGAARPIIVVLGAPNDEQGRLLPAAAGRAETALRVFQDDPSSRLILTGGFGAHFNSTARPHFEHLAAALIAGGVPAAAIIGRVGSSNTAEDAHGTAALLATHQGSLALRIVTSDFHVARARLLFTRAFAGRASETSIEMVASPAALSLEELSRALAHEAGAVARL
jgi:uncharacterized SAM-binding protein YcdF (DUF218 family)